MSVINNTDVSLNATININQGGASDGVSHRSAGFMANLGGFMLRCIPLFIISLFTGGGPPNSGGGQWRPK